MRGFFAFNGPDDPAFQDIRNFVESLEIPNKVSALESPAEEMGLLLGDLDAVMKRLENWVREDFAKNSIDRVRKGYSFDYVVSLDAADSTSLKVLTRLYFQGRSGNIYYGVTISRMQKNGFVFCEEC